MQLRWSPAAAEELSELSNTSAKRIRLAAQRIAKTIYDGAGPLKFFPGKGRTGRVEGTRELPLLPLLFVVVYRVLEDIVETANVVHGAQRWPPKE